MLRVNEQPGTHEADSKEFLRGQSQSCSALERRARHRRGHLLNLREGTAS